MKKSAGSRHKYLLPRALANVLNCSPRTVREWCKQGKISEAVQTPGGHWRLRFQKPFCPKTLILFESFADPSCDWRVEAQGNFEPEFAYAHAEAILYEKRLGFPNPDDLDLEPKKAEAALRVESLILEREQNGNPSPDLIFRGSVYQSWLANGRCPTAAEVADAMGMSRSTFYRHGHNSKKIVGAYHEHCEPIPAQSSHSFHNGRVRHSSD